MATIENKTRLNATIRAAIIENALVSSGLVAEERSIIEARAVLCEDIVNLELIRLGHTQDSIRKAYKALKSGRIEQFVYCSIGATSADPGQYNYVAVNLCGRRVYLYANGADRGGVATHLTKETHLHLKAYHDGGNFYPRGEVTVKHQDYAERFDAICARQTAANAKRTEITAAVGAAVKKAATIGKLLEIWPDVKDLLPKEYADPVGTGVALSVETLNGLCGLPK